MGPTVSFNLKRPDGSWFGYREVEKLASLSNIQLRVTVTTSISGNIYSFSHHLRVFNMPCSVRFTRSSLLYCLELYECYLVKHFYFN